MSPPLLNNDRWTTVFGIVLCLALIALFLMSFMDRCSAVDPVEQCPQPEYQDLREDVDELRLEVESLDEQLGVVWELTNVMEDRAPHGACQLLWEARVLTETEYVRCQVEAAEDAPHSD